MHNFVVNVTCEMLNVCSVFVDHLGLRTLVGRDELWDVENFRVVKDSGPYFLDREY